MMNPKATRFVLFVWILGFYLMASLPLRAQVAGATLSGTVTDESGGALPNAQISIKNVGTGVTRSIATDAAGFYTAPNLLPGSYEITVKAPGFKTMVRSGVTLTVGAEQSLNLTLQVGQIAQQVEVTGEAPAIQLTSSSIEALVPARTVVELPLNGRDWAQLTNLNPGVSQVQTQVPNGATAPRGNRGFGNAMTIAGTRPQMNNYRLDGISIVDYSGGSPASVLAQTLGVDAVGEFSVVTSNHSAEYGRTSGGVINAITRSGTNQLHGDVYWFLRDEGLDGRGAFDPVTPLPFHRNQFGASAGGPIQKDKMFFFANYEGFRQARSNALSSKVPTQNARNGIIGSGAPVGSCPAGTTLFVPGKSNICVNNKVIAFLPFWPVPPASATGDTASVITGVENDGNEDFVTSKIDRKFSDKDSLAGSFFYDNALNGQADPLLTVFNANTSKRIMSTVEETHIFTPALVNAFRVGYSRIFLAQNNPIRAVNPLAADTSGIVSAIAGRPAPAISVTGLQTFKGGLGEASLNTQKWNSYQLYDDAFLTKGVHSLKFGFAAENMRHGPLNVIAQNGSWGFPSLTAFLTNGAPNAASNAGPSTRMGLRQTLFGGYIQDDWRFRPNLTLNLGLRYEASTVISEEQGRTADLHVITDPQPFCDKFLPGCAPGGGNPAFNNPTLRNFEPRVGFAWDPFRTGKTSVRGAFGMFDVLPLSYQFFVGWATYPFVNPRIQISADQFNPGDFPDVNATIQRLGLTGNGQTSIRLIEHNPPRSYVMVWNLNVQRQLTASTNVTLGFVGNRGVHLFIPSDSLNMVIPQNTSAGLLWPGGVVNGKSLIGSGSLPNPNPLIQTIGGATWNTDAYYDALEAQVTKRMSHGFQVQAAYTFGKNIDTGSGATISDQYQNSIAALPWFCTRCSRGLSDFNVAHKLTVNYIWDVPSPKVGGALGSHVLGGWEVGGIIMAQSGTPFTVLISGDPQGLNITSASILVTPDQVPGCNPVAPNYRTTLQYVNYSCFTLPKSTSDIASQCTPFGYVSPSKPGIAGTCANLLGNAGRNTLIGPGLSDFDFSVYKNNRFPRISETFNAQLRVEFFNVLNHPSFQAPVNNNYLFDQHGASAGAGQLDTVTVPGREIQLALKLIF